MNCRNTVFFFLLFVICCSFGCASLKMRTADNFFDDLAYYDALRNYEQVAKKNQYPKAILRTAECYRLLNINKAAEQWYSLAMEDVNIEPKHQLEYAKVLMKNGNYELAKKYFNKYLVYDRNNKTIEDLMHSCDSLEYLFYNDTTMYKIKLLEWNELNSSSFSPLIYKSGILFVSDRDHVQRTESRNPYTGKNTYDIFFVKLTEFDNWLKPEPIYGNVNSFLNEGPFAVTASNDTMYFTRNNFVGEKAVKNLDNLSTLKIYRAVLRNAEWMVDGSVEMNSEDYSVAHPTISKDGKLMIFISDMPWGYGGTDLYYSNQVKGQWTTPKNLGQIINTSENEVFPFLHNDSILYFSSGANKNMGGLDIFYSIFSNGSWSKPINLGYPVNSTMDDFGFVIDEDGKSGYFNSNRKGADMIYSFTKGIAKIHTIITLTDKETKGKLHSIPVRLYANNVKIDTKISNNNGMVDFILEPDKKYKITAGNNSFYYKDIYINTTGVRESNTRYYSLPLNQILLNEININRDIKFRLKSISFLDDNKKPVNELFKILNENPTIKIAIISYTSSVGSSSSNKNLTIGRANAIKDYLVKKGIKADRIFASGEGESKLLNHCKDGILCLDEEHAENDRIEIKVIGFIP